MAFVPSKKLPCCEPNGLAFKIPGLLDTKLLFSVLRYSYSHNLSLLNKNGLKSLDCFQSLYVCASPNSEHEINRLTFDPSSFCPLPDLVLIPGPIRSILEFLNKCLPSQRSVCVPKHAARNDHRAKLVLRALITFDFASSGKGQATFTLALHLYSLQDDQN